LIKFGYFYDKIDDSFEKVATGHYAQVSLKCESQVSRSLKCESQVSSFKLQGCEYLLKIAPDPIKDQTYFLSHLTQGQLSRALFPIGRYTKSEVRELAEKYDLPNKKRKDSQGICFLGKIPYREFIKEHLGEKLGAFINKESGETVGEHMGYWFYTIGQRTGLGLSGGPWFVIDKDIKNNIVYLAQGRDPAEVYKKEFDVGDLSWINKSQVSSAGLKCGSQVSSLKSQVRVSSLKSQVLSLKSQVSSLKCESQVRVSSASLESQVLVKIRHGASSHSCTVEQDGDKLHVVLKEPVHGVAPGQFAVFYYEDVCLGGGKIV